MGYIVVIAVLLAALWLAESVARGFAASQGQSTRISRGVLVVAVLVILWVLIVGHSRYGIR